MRNIGNIEDIQLELEQLKAEITKNNDPKRDKTKDKQ